VRRYRSVGRFSMILKQDDACRFDGKYSSAC